MQGALASLSGTGFFASTVIPPAGAAIRNAAAVMPCIEGGDARLSPRTGFLRR